MDKVFKLKVEVSYAVQLKMTFLLGELRNAVHGEKCEQNGKGIYYDYLLLTLGGPFKYKH